MLSHVGCFMSCGTTLCLAEGPKLYVSWRVRNFMSCGGSETLLLAVGQKR